MALPCAEISRHSGPVAVRIGGSNAGQLDDHPIDELSFLQTVLDPQTFGIVWEVSSRLQSGPEVVAAIRRRFSQTPILLRADLRKPQAVQLIIEAAEVAADLTVSLVAEDYAAAVTAWKRRCNGLSAEQHVLRRIAPRVPLEARAPLIAIILAKQRMRVPQVAEQCGWSIRSLQAHLRAARLPNARVLLGWAVALHTTWRLEALGFSLKQAAAEAGFPDSTQLSNYIWRTVGYRPSVALKKGFGRQLEEFSDLLDLGNDNSRSIV